MDLTWSLAPDVVARLDCERWDGPEAGTLSRVTPNPAGRARSGRRAGGWPVSGVLSSWSASTTERTVLGGTP
jgi:hypothetical protein